MITHVPSIRRMCFTNVYHQEFYTVTVLCVQIMETHGSFDERRSGEAAENKRNRFSFPEVRQTNRVLSVDIA